MYGEFLMWYNFYFYFNTNILWFNTYNNNYDSLLSLTSFIFIVCVVIVLPVPTFTNTNLTNTTKYGHLLFDCIVLLS